MVLIKNSPVDGIRIRNLHRHEQRCHLHQFLLPAEQNALRYSIATSHVGEARIWPHRLLKGSAVCLLR
jgi:hypothetical protein